MDEKIKKIYELSVSLYHEVADNNMLRCGHPGVACVDNQNYGTLLGSIETLKQISEKIRNHRTDQFTSHSINRK